MSEQRIEVTIGARIDELLTEFQKATTSITKSVNSIAQNVDVAMERVEASSNEATRAIQRTESESRTASSGIMSSFGNLGSFLSGALAGIIASFSLKEAISTVVEFSETAVSLNNAAQVIGTTAESISRLHQSAIILGFSTQEVDKGMMKLARSISDASRGADEQAKAFKAVGISADDLKSMSVEEVLAKISDKFKDSEDGATKSAIAMTLLGRSGAEMIPWLNQGSEAMAAVADEAASMGGVMSEEAVAAGLELDDALDKLGMKTEGLQILFSQSLAPAISFIAEMFTEGSGTATSFGDVFKIVASIVVGVTGIIKAAWEVVSSIVRGITAALLSIIDATVKAASMDWTGAKAALQTGKEMITETFVDMADNLEDLADKTGAAFSNIWDGAKKPDDVPDTIELPKGELEFEGRGTGGSGGKDAAALAKKAADDKFAYELEMLKNQLDAAQRGSDERLRIHSEMMEKIKEKYGEESKEYARAQRDQIKIVEEVETEKRRVKDAALGKARDYANHEIEIERGKLDLMLATGQINAVQKLQMEREFANQQYAMQLAYLEQRMALYAMEPQIAAAIYAQIEQLKREHLLRMQDFQLQDFEANKAQWDSYFQVINNAFSQSIQGMIFQGTTLREAMGNILQAILGQLIQTGVQMATNWAASQLAMTSATVAGATARTTAEVTSAKASTVANAGAAIKNIVTKAAEVFANVYNAIAGIPYVGPFLAPVMAVAAGAAVIGMVGKVASAEGGWDRVPADGSKAILHKEEMVLPAPLAEGIRQMVEQGGGRGGPSVTINALDRRSVERYFSDNGDILARVLSDQWNNNPGGF